MFGLIFVSDGQNESLLIMALILVAQLALLLYGIVSVCYTCTCTLYIEGQSTCVAMHDYTKDKGMLASFFASNQHKSTDVWRKQSGGGGVYQVHDMTRWLSATLHTA